MADSGRCLRCGRGIERTDEATEVKLGLRREMLLFSCRVAGVSFRLGEAFESFEVGPIVKFEAHKNQSETVSFTGKAFRTSAEDNGIFN